MSNAEVEAAAATTSAEWRRLDQAVHRLVKARNAWRRRAQAAEARVAELDAVVRRMSSGDVDPVSLAARADELAEENRALRQRMAAARERVHRLLRRLDLLEEAR